MKNKIEEAKKSMPGKKLHLKNDKFNQSPFYKITKLKKRNN